MKEPSKNRDIWDQVLFGSLWGMVRFGLSSYAFFTFGFKISSVVGKTLVLVWFVLAGFVFFLICNYNI